MAAAKGDVVALTEDHCIVAAEWLEQLLLAQQKRPDVVGGPMDNAQRERMIDWAAYFADYGFFEQEDSKRPNGPSLTCANVAYSNRVVDDVIAWSRQGEWENVIHARLNARGCAVQFLRTALVYQNKNYSFWDFCCDRFVHGRDFARRRLVDHAFLRCLYFPGSLVLPVVLTVRIARASE